jgi:hypothetical protein
MKLQFFKCWFLTKKELLMPALFFWNNTFSGLIFN